jgi:hypothetical protein
VGEAGAVYRRLFNQSRKENFWAQIHPITASAELDPTVRLGSSNFDVVFIQCAMYEHFAKALCAGHCVKD